MFWRDESRQRQGKPEGAATEFGRQDSFRWVKRWFWQSYDSEYEDGFWVDDGDKRPDEINLPQKTELA